MTSSGGSVNFVPPIWSHADHYEIGIEFGLRAELDGRLGYDAQVLGTGAAQDAVQPACGRPGGPLSAGGSR